ncbi:unnamed protein product [Adineta steineri]|uniref:Uncharacterized protein n=1 Tax=Adineta steineri TaxID=433720 RepID=A0A818YT61_9BILA|nr:unnamed protein product [Adineta steineri]CAF3758792.1 unnamed protein product [Adineta steineri]
MATVLTTSITSSTILENVVKCAICFDFYDDRRLLPCSHKTENIGEISSNTLLTDIDDTRLYLNLSELLIDQEKYEELNENYAYGYRFDLSKPIKFNAISIKAKLFNCPLPVFIIDYNDILIYKEIFNLSENNSTTSNWIKIPMESQIEHNFCLFLWAPANQELIPMITYKDSNHNLRKLNEQISIRSKRAQINQSTDLHPNSKIDVLYDALSSIDDDQNEKTIPALEMILHI